MARAVPGFALLLVVATVLPSCAPEPPERPAVPATTVRTEPPASFDALPPVVRFRVAGVTVPASGVLLIRDPLSSYHEARIKGSDLPSTLTGRRVPATAFVDDASGEIVVAPSLPLDAGATYTLAALGKGTLATMVVTSEAGPYAARVFPRGAAAGGSRWVFCGADIPVAEGVSLDPGALPAVATPGAASGASGDGASCFHVDVEDAPEEGYVIPPPLVGGAFVDPSPVSFRPAPGTPAPAVCKGAEVPLGPGCAAAYDDRIVVRSAAAPLLWALAAGPVNGVFSAAPSARFVLTGLEPATDVVVSGAVSDERGREAAFAVPFTLQPPLPHVVINEVLANPLGPEPAEEWIELVNDGATATSLEGFTIGDEGGESPLPPVTLEAGEFALVVPDAFDVRSHLDVVPREGTVLVRVPRLGQSGLSNSGERVTLRGPSGASVSSFPPIPAPAAGVSVSRRVPSGLDDDVRGFAPSAGQGASPGAPNDVPDDDG